MGTDLALRPAIQSGAFDKWRVLDLNGLPGGISVTLPALPNYVRRDFPDIDIHELPFDDGTFDLVLHSDTLEHVATPVLALQECRRVLVPGRRLCFTAPVIVGRLTRNRAGLPPSYHGSPGDNAGDFIVHNEFGADIWTTVFEAGFSDLAMSQVAYPSGIAISAWDREPQIVAS
jgi:SAM-dependent methyltransferase